MLSEFFRNLPDAWPLSIFPIRCPAWTWAWLGTEQSAFEGMRNCFSMFVVSVLESSGFHAGDPNLMAELVRLALTNNVAIGAHPGFQDLQGFGRRRPFVAQFVELDRSPPALRSRFSPYRSHC